MNTPAMQKMVKARAALILDQRFFGSLALKLQLKEDPTCDLMWTDGVSIGFNPEMVMQNSMDVVKGVICHEVFHCASNHHTRRNGRDASDWNVATDYTINHILVENGMKIHDGMLLDPNLKNKSADEIYNMVHGKKKEQQNGGQGSQGSSTQQQQGQQQGKGQGKGQQSKADPGGCGEVRDFPGETGTATEQELQQQDQEWKIAVAQAANQAKACGQLPGNLQELIKEMLEPQVPWREALQRFVEQISRNDYTYTRPNPRYIGFGVVLPSLHNKELPPIDIWVDTSGSVSTEEKKQFAGEINDIRSHYNTTIRVIFCDTKVNGVTIINPEDDFIELDCKGGGGTKFSPAIAWSMQQEEHPACGIYLTDMDCYDFGPEPEFPVLWIQTQGMKKTAPFGEVIRMQEKVY